MTDRRLSKTGLDRIHAVLTSQVEQGAAPGIVILLSHRGQVHVDTIGARALGGQQMTRDTIFRISSMTKPVVATAAMILVEEGAIGLDDPVDRWLPELADRRVLKRLDGPLDDTEPAHRAITVRDLLSLRMGFGFVFDNYPILAAVNEQQLGMGPPKPATPHTPDEWLRRFATLPLMHQPGEKWMYEMGFAVLGVLIARAASKPLETFLRDRIFTPLGMQDTGFSVPADKLDRLAACYTANPETGELELYDGVQDGAWSRPPVFPSATGGLVSTVDDYLAFARALMGNEILTGHSVEQMTTDQLTAEQRARSESVPVFLGNFGWGLGLAVVTEPDDLTAVPGRYGWDGGLGTSWYSDPDEDLIAILMTQRMAPSGIQPAFWTAVYQAIES
jgi:CubicO group peptidase (beta-lactamase class C family)